MKEEFVLSNGIEDVHHSEIAKSIPPHRLYRNFVHRNTDDTSFKSKVGLKTTSIGIGPDHRQLDTTS
jgi:hypothetical protein